MLCLCVDGTIQEIRVSKIMQIFAENGHTQVRVSDGSYIEVDDTEDNIRDMIREELKKVNKEERCIRLHLYYSSQKSGYYPICLPISAIKEVARSYHSYDTAITGKLSRDLPRDARENETDRQQPAIVALNYPIKDSRGDLVDSITVYESADYVMSFMNTEN